MGEGGRKRSQRFRQALRRKEVAAGKKEPQHLQEELQKEEPREADHGCHRCACRRETFTDIDLLNRCREHLETAINLHWPEFPHTFPYTGDDMTTVFFVRHAAPNLMNHDDLTRELSAKGLRDRLLVTEFLQTKRIDFVFSSPYRRAVETISDFAEKRRLEISLVNDFRERKVGNGWINNFDEFCQRQWNDFSFKLDDGESLHEVQTRNVTTLNFLLKRFPEKRLAVGSHGTALSTIINYYDKRFGYNEFRRIKNVMPWIVQFDFEGTDIKSIHTYDLFKSIQL